MNVMVEKFEQFEWLIRGTTAKSPNFEPVVHGTNEKPLDYQDRLGAVASMETQLAKSVTALIVFDDKSEMDYRHVQSHLALIMATNAKLDKRKEPAKVTIDEMASMIARMVIDFSLNPDLENNFTAQGRLYYAGLRSWQMDAECYRKTWKPYENLMVLAIENAIDEAAKTIKSYRKNTYKEFEA